MGRGKIQIKRIENRSNRQNSYSKRKSVIIKKAKEIEVLCDTQISLIIFGESGEMVEYITPSTTLIGILERLQRKTGKTLWDTKHEDLSNEIDRIKKENDSMEIVLKHLKGKDIKALKYKELGSLEEALENGLKGVRDKMSEVLRMYKRSGELVGGGKSATQFPSTTTFGIRRR